MQADVLLEQLEQIDTDTSISQEQLASLKKQLPNTPIMDLIVAIQTNNKELLGSLNITTPGISSLINSLTSNEDDQFIEKRLKKIINHTHKEKPTSGSGESLTENNLISETLAKLLVDQGQKLEAKRMYQQLILKFPEKSAFFVKQIEALNK